MAGSVVGLIGGSGLRTPSLLREETRKELDTPYGKPSDAAVVGRHADTRVVYLARHGRDRLLLARGCERNCLRGLGLWQALRD